MVFYSCIATLRHHHNDSINCIAFSDDASYLASGDDEGMVLLCKIPEATEYDRYHYNDSVTALDWAAGTSGVFVGLASCELHVLSLVSALSPSWRLFMESL